MSTQAISLLPPDPHMCNGDEKQTRSPLSLYSEYQRLDVELRPPHRMASSHWHGQVEVNVPFDGDVEYLINNEVVQIKQGHITVAVHKKRERDPKKMRHHVVSHFT